MEMPRGSARTLARGIPHSQRDVEDILVALEARNEQWPISTTGWNKLVMNDHVDTMPGLPASSSCSSCPDPREAIPTPPCARRRVHE